MHIINIAAMMFIFGETEFPKTLPLAPPLELLKKGPTALEKLAWWHGSTERRRFHRLDLEDLVDMPDEQVAEDATDEEIFKAVQQMRNDRENMEINGGDDSNGGSPQLEDKDGLFARKLEHGLAFSDGKHAWKAQKYFFDFYYRLLHV
ncbi:hypothetical protein B0H13DRAFT_1918758 [Mycena leptocephala]|nr:hypothetical protein B0H13DRAFT_1918758 [Mycena leptocephala]